MPCEVMLVVKDITTKEEFVYLRARIENLNVSLSNIKLGFRLAMGGKGATFQNELRLVVIPDAETYFLVGLSQIVVPITTFQIVNGKRVSQFPQSVGFQGFTKNGVVDNADGLALYPNVQNVVATLQAKFNNEVFFGSGKVDRGIDTRGLLYIDLNKNVPVAIK